MSIPVAVKPREYKEIAKNLKTETEVVCLDREAHIKTLMVGRNMIMTGKTVKAKIVKGY